MDKKNKRIYYAIAIAAISSSLLVGYWMMNKSPITSENSSKARYQGFFKDLVEPQANKRPVESNQQDISCLIEGINITPLRATVLDSLKVELQPRIPKDGQLTFEYQWQINGKVLEQVKGNVFPAGLAKKNDRVTVSIMPYVDGVEYKQFNYCITKNIYNAAPSLILAAEERKNGDIVTLHLVGSDPDGDNVVYALEEPFLEGMTIDKTTGKISWKPTGKEPGVYRFRASATDSDGSKTAKTFEFSLDAK